MVSLLKEWYLILEEHLGRDQTLVSVREDFPQDIILELRFENEKRNSLLKGELGERGLSGSIKDTCHVWMVDGARPQRTF